MNKRLLTVLAFALVVSGVASYLLYGIITDQLTAHAKAPTATIVVATHPLDLGSLIKDGDVKLGSWPGAIPPGALLKPEDAIGRGVIQPILEGEPLVESRLAPKGAGAGLAATIPTGMRAVAVRVNDIVGVAGFVIPGTHVDILIAGNPPGQNSSATGTLTKTLLQNVEVLSAGQNIQKDAEGKPISVGVVNMLVTPEQAEILSLASNETRIQLILRNPLDKDITKTPGTAIVNLFNGPKPIEPPPVRVARKAAAAPPPPPPPPPPVVTPPPAPVAAAPEPPKPAPPIVVEMIQGASKSQVQFKPENTGKDKSSEGKQ